MDSVWGTGEGSTGVPSSRLFIFSVFLCDFRVFRVMIRPSKRIQYTKPKYIQKSITVIPGSLECFPTPTRKPSVCLAKGVRFQRPPRPFRSTPTQNGGAKRQRTYSKASPPGFASLSTCSPTRVFDPRLFTNQRFALRLGSSTLACSHKGEENAPQHTRITD